MNKNNKILLGAGIISLLVGVVSYGYKPEILKKINKKDDNKALSILVILAGLVSLAFVADDLLLPEDEEELEEV